MNVKGQGFTHLLSSYIGDSVQSQAVVEFVDIGQILANTVDNQMQQLMFLMQKQCNSQITNLLLRVLCSRDKVDSLEMAKVDVPAQDVDVQQLANIFLLVVSTQAALLEFGSYVCQLFVDALLLEFSGAGVSQVCNEGYQAAHGVLVAAATTAVEQAAT